MQTKALNFDLVSILFGTSIPTSFNILVKMFLHLYMYAARQEMACNNNTMWDPIITILNAEGCTNGRSKSIGIRCIVYIARQRIMTVITCITPKIEKVMHVIVGF